MKTLIQLIIVAALFGGLSYAGSLWFKPNLIATAAVESPAATSQSPAGPPAPAKSDASQDSTPTASPDEASKEHSTPQAPSPADAAAGHPADGHGTPDATTAPSAREQPAVMEEPPVAIRPPYAPDGDEAGALITLLRERSRLATQAERRLAERQDAMQLIFEDLRSEQARMSNLRKRLADEWKTSQTVLDLERKRIDEERTALQIDLTETRRAAEESVRALTEERDQLRKQATQSPSPVNSPPATTGGTPEDNANLKKMATVFDSMSAENASRVFEQLVKNQRIDSVVVLLNAMKERQSAKVLGLLTESNPALAADLTDRLKKLKTSSNAAE